MHKRWFWELRALNFFFALFKLFFQLFASGILGEWTRNGNVICRKKNKNAKLKMNKQTLLFVSPEILNRTQTLAHIQFVPNFNRCKLWNCVPSNHLNRWLNSMNGWNEKKKHLLVRFYWFLQMKKKFWRRKNKMLVNKTFWRFIN